MNRPSEPSSGRPKLSVESPGDVSSASQDIVSRSPARTSSPSRFINTAPAITSTIRKCHRRGALPAGDQTLPPSSADVPDAEPVAMLHKAAKLVATFPRKVRRKRGVAASETAARDNVDVPPPPPKRMRQDVFEEISDATVPHRPSDTSPDLQFPAYLEGILDGTISFYHIDPRTWVGEVYDPTQLARHHGVNKWAVVRAEYDLDGHVRHWCSRCEDFKKYQTCCHVLLLSHEDCPPFSCKSETGQWLLVLAYVLPLMNNSDNPPATAFHNDWVSPTDPQLVSFVCLSSDHDIAIFVSYFGTEANNGRWRCSKHRDIVRPHHDGSLPGDACEHIKECWATKIVDRLVWYARVDTPEEPPETEVEMFVRRIERASRLQRDQQWDERSVSHLPVGPPAWCRLPEDTAPSYPTLFPPPQVIELGDNALCQCGSKGNQSEPPRRSRATVYGSVQAWEIEIETVPCTKCSPRSGRNRAGPDMREFGLFNFDNQRIFTHELLNKYTDSIATHEIAFHAYAKVTQRSYANQACSTKFVSDHIWVTVWFSFMRIQQLRDSFGCVICGPEPRVVIFDGCTAGFGAEHVTDTLCPPTTIVPGHAVRANVRPPGKVAAITHRIRSLAQQVVRWRKSLIGGQSQIRGISAHDTMTAAVDADADATAAQKQAQKRTSERDKHDQEMRSRLSEVIKALNGEEELKHVAVMFEATIGAKLDTREENRRGLYLALLNEIFAYESILMFIPRPTWAALHILCEKDDENTVRFLQREVPALGSVAVFEMQHGGITQELKSVAKWLLKRAAEVRASLPQHHTEPANEDIDLGPEASIAAGVFYGRKKVRHRPAYPNLPHDNAVDRATLDQEVTSGGIGCSKFYEWYGVKGQTGGIMGCWCPHLVCLGFHLIPKGEGRNDVFSALYCYWKQAPWYIIYDFACALGPYCMAREPEFFENTRMLIDGFHAVGHTRCSAACFLSTYRAHSRNLSAVNSSAAECGNGGLLKIRRAVSYMSQQHAMVFVLVFLAMWNRARRMKDARLVTTAETPPLPLDWSQFERLNLSEEARPSLAAQTYIVQPSKM